MGEVWKLNSNPHDLYEVVTCYNEQNGNTIKTKAALLTYSEQDATDIGIKSEFLPWHKVEILDTEKYGEKVKTVEYHPTQKETLACVIDNKVILYDRGQGGTKQVAEISATGSSTKHINPFNTGKWSHHHQGQQFIALHENHVRAYDIRDTQHITWSIEEAHGQLIRDIDCNPNKQCHFVTGGDDGFIKIWDCRLPKEPVFVRNDHAHWIWSVRFNTFHDQLILSSSSDCKVVLTCASSVSSEAVEEQTPTPTSHKEEGQRKFLADGLLQTFDQHEDSVYCVEWSNVDPWIFASLSYDGRLLISKVPKQYKYQIIL